MSATIEEIKSELVELGIIADIDATTRPLTGGVSSDIHLIEDGTRRVVVKQALADLRVKAKWQVDVGRNISEQRFIQQVQNFLPQAVPNLIHCSETKNYFVMEYLGDACRDWKSILLQGRADSGYARRAGEILARIHGDTWDRPDLQRLFETTAVFHSIRTEPYLLTAGARHPKLAQFFELEAQRLEQTRLCLIHGDYSPKNMLVGPGRMVVIDCEVAWYGEPAFDLAFLFNHFLLKSLHHQHQPQPFIDLVPVAWRAYQEVLGAERLGDMETRCARLLLMLLLARIDGKSPVEYLQHTGSRQLVRGFVHDLLPREIFDLSQIGDHWRSALQQLNTV